MSGVLLATLGSEPQVVSLAVQLLDRAGFALATVAVLHTDATRAPVRAAVDRLRAFFAPPHAGPPLTLLPIAIPDVLTPAQLDAFGTALYQHLHRFIAQGRPVHLLLAGGRKSMTMVGMTIAQMLLGPHDHVWYLHSDEELRLSGRPGLAGEDEARLIAIPLPRQSPAPPLYARAFLAETPAHAHALLAEDHQRRIRFFWDEELTPAEREVAQLSAAALIPVETVAARLHKSPKTVTNQLNVVYSKMESIFGLQPQIGLKREFLRYLLAEYQAQLGANSQDSSAVAVPG